MADLREQVQAALGTGFTLGRELGGGGMSRVFIATDETLGRHIVVKVLPPELAEDVNVDRFRREIRLAATLQEPLIVPVLTAGEANGLVYYTMPLVQGESLKARLDRERQLPQSDVVRIMRDVLTALSYAHRHGVVHRDVKPANVLLTGPHALVADFGIAKALTASLNGDRLTGSGVALGTPAYMAPEQVMGDQSVDHRADLFAVGSLGYEMLAGQVPFTGSTTHQVVARVVTENPTALLSLRPSTSPALADLVHRLLAKNPADRPQSAEEVLNELSAMSTSGERVIEAKAAPKAQVRRPTQRQIAWSLVAAAVVIAAFVAFPRLRSAVTGIRPDENARRAPQASLRTIAVLPFANESAEKENEFLADGITDGLNAALTALPGLRVIGRTSAHAIKGQNLDERAIGSMLGAAFLVEGSVARAADSMRVRVHLVSAADRASLWTNTYYRKIGGVFAMEEEIVRAIVSSLQVQLTAGAPTPSAPRLTSSDAYDLYVHGMALYNARTELPRAIEYFKAAIARDSLFAEPHAGLANVYVVLINDFGRTDLRGPAKAEAMQAVALRPKSGEAHASLGGVLFIDRDLAGAERQFRSAIALAPSCLAAHDKLALVLAFRGLRDESFSENRLARAIDPISEIIAAHAAWIFAMGRQYDSALVELRRAAAIDDGSEAELYHDIAGEYFVKKGRFADALVEYRKAAALSKQDTLVSLNLAYLYAKEGKRADAERILAALLATGDSAANANAGGLAMLYAALGDKDRAFRWLATEARDSVLPTLGIATEPEFDALHTDPRWPSLMRTLGLAP